MAGQPYLRKLSKWIEQQGGDEYILDQIADGVPVGRVASAITVPGYTRPVSRPMLYKWRDSGGEERVQGWALAIEASGDSHAEDAGTVLTDLPEGFDKEALGQARAISSYKQWIAGKLNKRYSEQKDSVRVELNVGELHLDALRQAGHMDRIEDADFKVLHSGDSSDTD